jgi:hypothetical protein
VQSDWADGIPTAVADGLAELDEFAELAELAELAPAEAGWLVLPAETLPHAAVPIRAVTAIRPRTPRALMASLLFSTLGRAAAGGSSAPRGQVCATLR